MDTIVWTASPQGDEATLAINMEGPLFSYAAPGSVPCAIAGPVFEIDNALVKPDFAAIRAAGVKELGGGIPERRFVADYRGLDGLALTIVVRTAAASPVVRFRYILADAADRKLTKRTTGRDAIEYASFTAAQEARVTEVRLSDFNHLLNCYRPTETTLSAYAFEHDLTAPGPILASVSGAGAFLMAYEHGSTLPNTFFEYRLAPDRRVTLAAVKANYFHNRSLKEQPFESVWFDFAAIKGTADGSTDGLAAVFRKFLLEHITPHAASRKPFVSLNTWGFQERSKWLDGAGFLDALEQDRLLEEIDAAHRAGIETFVIDVGWFNSAGDWRPHPRYSDGFKPIRERLDRYGMKLGVWIHAAWAGNDSEVRQLVLAKGTFTGVAHASGLGAYLDTCTTLVSNCVFDSNSVIGQPRYSYMDAPKGGGIYASGGTLEVVDCLVTNCVLTKSEDNCRSFGGGIYAITTDVTVRRTTFIGNLIGNAAQNSFGSAIYLEGANAVIDECLFTSNRTYSRRASGGSAIYATGVSSLDISNSRFFGNAARGNSTFGGTLALVGSETTTTTRLDRCVFRGNGYDPSTASFNSGSIGMNGGRLEMSHCLVAELNVRVPADPRNRSGDYKRSIDIALGTLLLDACTIAGNDGYGIYRDITYGVVGIQNSIIYSNTLGNVNIDTATYSCMEGEVTGEGVFADDPLLSDDGYYHPRSAAGRLADGYFAGTSWVTDAVTSPTIDAGPVDGEWYKEPQPNNLRVNIGYDANTAAASKSATGDYVAFDGITVVPLPPTNVTATSAYPMGIVGEVGGDGTIPATVTLVWDSSDKGTNALADWAHSVPLGTFAKWDILSTLITGIEGGSLCYRFFAENTMGSSWSVPYLYAIPVMPAATDAVVSHIRRHSVVVSTTLTDNGNDVCTATVIYWLTDDPQTTWSASASAIPEGEITRIPLTELASVSAYAFRLEVENQAGKVTSEGSFTTAPDDVPQFFYITPEGAGIRDGTSWDNAYAGLLPIVNECQGVGDIVYMKHGSYNDFSLVFGEQSQVVIENAAGLTVRGGYAGEGAPGALSDQPTEITRHTDNAFRLLRFRNSTLRLENLVFHSGSVSTGEGDGGAAIALNTCNTLIADCLFSNNACRVQSGSYGKKALGGAVFANGGSLVVTNCNFSNNRVGWSADNSSQFGGAIATWNTALGVQGCRFEGNYSQMSFKVVYGGAIYTRGGTVNIRTPSSPTTTVRCA